MPVTMGPIPRSIIDPKDPAKKARKMLNRSIDALDKPEEGHVA